MNLGLLDASHYEIAYEKNNASPAYKVEALFLSLIEVMEIDKSRDKSILKEKR
jgi:hypothetical protein